MHNKYLLTSYYMLDIVLSSYKVLSRDVHGAASSL